MKKSRHSRTGTTKTDAHPHRQLVTVACFALIDTDYGRDLARGINQYAQSQVHWQVLHGELIGSDGWLTDHPPDGVITQNCREEFVAMLRERGLPAINVSALLADVPLPSVLTNNRLAGVQAAEHLLEQGLERFAVVGDCGKHFAQERVDGFCERIKAAGRGCVVLPAQGPGNDWLASAQQAPRHGSLGQALWKLPKPVGLLAVSHNLALAALRLCLAQRIRVPEDLALISGDGDLLHCDSVQPAISSVDLNGLMVGLEAARQLGRLMQGHSLPSAPRFVRPAGVWVRPSSVVAHPAEPSVAMALSYLQSQYHRPLYSGDIARHLNQTPAALQRAFVRVRGRSVISELTQIRLSRARQLLAETELPLTQVAQLCGFTRPEYFSALFRRECGEPPREYRQRQAQPNASA